MPHFVRNDRSRYQNGFSWAYNVYAPTDKENDYKKIASSLHFGSPSSPDVPTLRSSQRQNQDTRRKGADCHTSFAMTDQDTRMDSTGRIMYTPLRTHTWTFSVFLVKYNQNSGKKEEIATAPAELRNDISGYKTQDARSGRV